MTTREFRGMVSLGKDSCDQDAVYIDDNDIVSLLTVEHFHQGHVRVLLDDIEVAYGDIEIDMLDPEEEGDVLRVDDTDILARVRDLNHLYVHLIISDDLPSPPDTRHDQPE